MVQHSLSLLTDSFAIANMLKLQWVRRKIFCMVLIAVTIGFVWKYTLTEFMARHPRSSSPGVTRLWYKQPILSVYIPSRYQGNYCASGYEAVMMNNTVSSISSGPCGCAQNTRQHRSTNASCSHSKAGTCVMMPGLPAIESTSWRQSTICVKRGGEAAAAIKNIGGFKVITRAVRNQMNMVSVLLVTTIVVKLLVFPLT